MPPGACLRALTRAALALPGLAASLGPVASVGSVAGVGLAGAATTLLGAAAPVVAFAAPGDEIRLQYGRYEEGERRLPGVQSRFDPIDVDFLAVGATAGFLDRFRFSLDYHQDTWSGATPIASAPRSLHGNRASAPDGVSGATPFVSGNLYLDGGLEVLESDLFGNLSGRLDPGLVHTLSAASPETRKALDFGIEHEWDEAQLGLGGGVSIEPDHLSGFARLSGRLDLDRKRSVVGFSATVARSAIDAHLDHDAAPYIDVSTYAGEIHNQRSGSPVLRDERTDWTLEASLARLLGRSTRVEGALQFRRAEGYLANPYKVVEVAFIDPDQQFLAPPGGFYGDVHALLERRPDTRNQVVLSARLLQDVAPIEGAASLRYAFAHDDWGIDAHTLEAEWRQQLGATWLVTPRLRYTTQGAADFYQPFLVSQQAYLRIVTDPGGGFVGVEPFDRALLPDAYSGDHRLSAFGVLSGGISIQKRLFRGFVLDLGFEYARYAGSLRLGGGGEGAFARYDTWLVDASLRVDLAALALAREGRREIVLVERDRDGAGDEGAGHGGAGHVGVAHGPAQAPAGVMFAHALPAAGDFMLGYRTMYMRRDGDIEEGSKEPSDGVVVDRACGDPDCTAAAASMGHQMHMLDLMFAPTSWLTLALMPTYVDHDMRVRALDGAVPDVHSGHDHHATGGFGDTRFGALVPLLAGRRDHANLALLVSAPTGDTSQRFRRDHQTERGFVHYPMQLGSGTWDFLPALTYQGERGRWRFGAQTSASVRMEHEGRTGYALGDEVQVTAWGGLAVTDWLGLSLRGLYTHAGRIRGRYDRPILVRTPGDRPANSGGRLFDLGVGLALTVPRGSFEGMALSLEWIQPLAEDWNGYQLERTGTLAARWGMHF
ncbi:MAG: DUF3570 domain-containing protein [Myxococcota bacterium]